jgi:hypothetical protein
MILNSTPQNEAVLSNVGEIGEFRIRNSAKAFSILSSGLYANKIRAIIRELSCNATDSHVAAGRANTPFDVHLPNQLEPWFSVRDYGVGLDHDQVTQIYTTYFESTKTGSNDFIGALGLGSKTPFSYTDNFTVTAIKDCSKRIYSAFINAQGVPSIALMTDNDTDEPNGVEVKFSVNQYYDYTSFRREAETVFTHFKLRPVVSGCNNFKVEEVVYEDKNIVPGIHSVKGRGYQSVAIMGNIAYPIDVPSTDTTLGKLRDLLSCNLEIHFGIGELDFQASREGLSYIPQTVEAIKRKLEALNAQLATYVAKEADAISCLWSRAIFLMEKKETALWSAAVFKYVSDTKFPLIKIDNQRLRSYDFSITVDALAAKHNLALRGFEHRTGEKKCSTMNPASEFDYKTNIAGPKQWEISVGAGVHFVKNTGKVGALERAKHHWRNTKSKTHYNTIFVMERVDKKKPAAFDAFIKSISSPPSYVDVSTLMEKPRKASMGKNVTIMKLERKGSNGYSRYSRTQDDVVWRDAGKSDSFDAKATHYYLPLSGYIADTKYIKGVVSVVAHPKQIAVKELFQDLKDCGVPNLNGLTIYGVRKGDYEFIKTQKNWVNLEDYIASQLSVVDDNFLKGLTVQAIDNYSFIKYNNAIASRITDTDSPFLKLTTEFKDRKRSDYSQHSLNRLCANYTAGTVISPEALVKKVKDECEKVYKRYPLFKSLSTGSSNYEAVAEYINLVDAARKG